MNRMSEPLSVPDPELVAWLLALCKGLLDEERLVLLGALARGKVSLATLQADHALGGAAIGRHLRQLQELGLIREQTEADHGTTYMLDVTELNRKKRRLFASSAPMALPREEEIVSRFVRDGRLAQLPAKGPKLRLVLAWLAEQFEPERRYPEREFSRLLEPHEPDPATLRRLLVDYGFFQREAGLYWRAEQSGT